MPVRWGRQVLLLCVSAGLVTSCAGHKEERGSPFAGWVPPGQVPPALEEISDAAVDIIDLAASDAWPQVYADVQDISDTWSDYKHPTVVPSSYPRPADALLYGQLDTALARLKEAAAARNADATMRAANDVDAATVDLVEFYNPNIPPDLHRLAVLERSILLDAWDDNLDAAADTLTQVRRTWQHVRPVIVDHASVDAIETFDDSLIVQQKAIDARESIVLGNYAQNTLIMIKEMERLSY